MVLTLVMSQERVAGAALYDKSPPLVTGRRKHVPTAGISQFGEWLSIRSHQNKLNLVHMIISAEEQSRSKQRREKRTAMAPPDRQDGK